MQRLRETQERKAYAYLRLSCQDGKSSDFFGQLAVHPQRERLVVHHVKTAQRTASHRHGSKIEGIYGVFGGGRNVKEGKRVLECNARLLDFGSNLGVTKEGGNYLARAHLNRIGVQVNDIDPVGVRVLRGAHAILNRDGNRAVFRNDAGVGDIGDGSVDLVLNELGLEWREREEGGVGEGERGGAAGEDDGAGEVTLVG